MKQSALILSLLFATSSALSLKGVNYCKPETTEGGEVVGTGNVYDVLKKDKENNGQKEGAQDEDIQVGGEQPTEGEKMPVDTSKLIPDETVAPKGDETVKQDDIEGDVDEDSQENTEVESIYSEGDQGEDEVDPSLGTNTLPPQVNRNQQRQFPGGGCEAPPQLFFPSAEELRSMMYQQRIRDETYIKLVEFVSSLFPEGVQSMNEISQLSEKAVPFVEKFIMEKLNETEQRSLTFQSAYQLFEFVKSVGASRLPEPVKRQLWNQMQAMMQKQRESYYDGDYEGDSEEYVGEEEEEREGEGEEGAIDGSQGTQVQPVGTEIEVEGDGISEEERLRKIQEMQDHARQAQKQRAEQMLEAHQRREEKLMLVKKIRDIVRKEKDAFEKGLPCPLTQDEKELLAKVRGITKEQSEGNDDTQN